MKRLYATSHIKSLREKGLERATINKAVNSLVSFNDFLIRKGYCHEMCIDPKKDKIKIAGGSEKEVEVFSGQEEEKILFYAEKISMRDCLIINMLVYTGMRIGELVNLRIDDIDFIGMSVVVKGKGNKQREIPIKPEFRIF